MTPDTAVIVGNGLSRKGIIFDSFKLQKIPIFGCNAFYRTDDPDYLVAVDEKMIAEINQSSFPKERILVPSSPEEFFEPREHNPNRPRQNAGMFAMLKAIQLGHKNLLCFGMDFIIEDYELNLGNVYDSTPGYEIDTKCSVVDSMKRCEYMDWFASKNLEVKFVFLFPSHIRKFRTFKSINISGTYFETFSRSNNIRLMSE